MTALLRLASGVAVDRAGRCKAIALAGYGRLGSGVPAGPAGGRRVVGRSSPASWRSTGAAKGARTVPRDVLISLSSRPDGLATAFGVHRALDSAGAMLGPLAALGILAALPNALRPSSSSPSFSVGGSSGLGVLLLFVTNAERPPAPTPDSVTPPPPPSRRPPRGAALLEVPGLLRLTAAATMLGAVTVSDGFLYLLLQREAGFSPGLVPLLYVGTARAAIWPWRFRPADWRIASGGRAAFLAGYGLLAAAYAATMQSGIGPPGVAACLLLLGAPTMR